MAIDSVSPGQESSLSSLSARPGRQPAPGRPKIRKKMINPAKNTVPSHMFFIQKQSDF